MYFFRSSILNDLFNVDIYDIRITCVLMFFFFHFTASISKIIQKKNLVITTL